MTTPRLTDLKESGRRIPQSELMALKASTPIEELVAKHGVQLRRQGADLVGLCPFHDDKMSSLVVSPSDNLWHCFGCNAVGSVVDWVMRIEGCGFREAAARLRAQSAHTPSSLTVAEGPTVPASVNGASRAGELWGGAKRLDWVTDFYHQTLKASHEAKAYLAKRGLGGDEVIEYFKLGYSNHTLGFQLAGEQTRAGKAQRRQLKRCGVLRANGYEHLNGTVVIPLRGRNGAVSQLYGRQIESHLRGETAKHLYLRGEARGVFNAVGLKGQRHVILCEALIDALTFWCAGLRNVTSCFGVHGFTAELRKLLSRKGIWRVTLAFDRDDAGEAAAQRIGAALIAMGKSVSIAQFPPGMDANSYGVREQPASESLSQVVKSAVWLGGGRRARQLAAAAERKRVKAEKKAAAKARPASRRLTLKELQGIVSPLDTLFTHDEDGELVPCLGWPVDNRRSGGLSSSSKCDHVLIDHAESTVFARATGRPSAVP